MGSLITIRNDGPDPVALLLGGHYQKVIAAGRQCVFSVNCAVSFEPVRRLTRQELAEQSGLPPPPDEPLGRFAEN
jgi:hypothetical protein